LSAVQDLLHIQGPLGSFEYELDGVPLPGMTIHEEQYT
jgi:hypothetical protein